MPHEIINDLFRQEFTPQSINPGNMLSIEIVLSKPFSEASDNPIFDDITYEQFEIYKINPKQ